MGEERVRITFACMRNIYDWMRTLRPASENGESGHGLHVLEAEIVSHIVQSTEYLLIYCDSGDSGWFEQRIYLA